MTRRPSDPGEGFVVVPAAVWADLVARTTTPRPLAPCLVGGGRVTTTGDVCGACWTFGSDPERHAGALALLAQKGAS